MDDLDCLPPIQDALVIDKGSKGSLAGAGLKPTAEAEAAAHKKKQVIESQTNEGKTIDSGSIFSVDSSFSFAMGVASASTSSPAGSKVSRFGRQALGNRVSLSPPLSTPFPTSSQASELRKRSLNASPEALATETRPAQPATATHMFSLYTGDAARNDKNVIDSEMPKSTKVNTRVLDQRPSASVRSTGLCKLALILALICLMSIVWGFLPVLPQTIGKGQPNPFQEDWLRDYIQRQAKLIVGGATSEDRTLSKSFVSLRFFLQKNPAGFSLALAPSFFGFYGYFGVLAAWDEHLTGATDAGFLRSGKIRGLAGASAGAMAAVLLAAGIPPRLAGDFCSNMTLDKFADFPGVGGIFKGNKFEKIMEDFLKANIEGSDKDRSLLFLQNAQYPVAVTGFCLQSMERKILDKGSMARAARASATFPFLFEPVGWRNKDGDVDYTLIDGGLADPSGVEALKALDRNLKGNRVVNLKIGEFWGKKPPGPADIPDTQEVLSISIQNLPQPGPFHLENGPVALQAAYDAMVASLDVPLMVDSSGSHYELHIDASPFWGKQPSLKEEEF